jgi:protein NEDD1
VCILFNDACGWADLVVASAGEDRKISMWMKNGQAVGVVPLPGAEADDTIDVSPVFPSFLIFASS